MLTSTRPAVSISTSARRSSGPRRYGESAQTASVLYSPMVISAKDLSKVSPAVPIYGISPHVRVSPNRTEVYCGPASLWCPAVGPHEVLHRAAVHRALTFPATLLVEFAVAGQDLGDHGVPQSPRRRGAASRRRSFSGQSHNRTQRARGRRRGSLSRPNKRVAAAGISIDSSSSRFLAPESLVWRGRDVGPRAASRYQRLRAHLTELELTVATEALPSVPDQAPAEGLSLTVVLERLLAVEVDAITARRLTGRLRFASLPTPAILADFDADTAAGIDLALIGELGTCRYLESATNVLLIGPPGTGKTRLSAGLARAAAHAGFRAYFTTAADLAARCHRAAIEGRRAMTMRFYAEPTLLVIDELGCLPRRAEAASALFQDAAQSYLETGIVMASNRAVGAWGEVLGVTTVVAAMLGRLLHRSVVINLDRESYRLREHRTAPETLCRAASGTRQPLH